MSSDMDDTDKVQIFCRDAQDNGVEVLPDDVNHSGCASSRWPTSTRRVSRRAPCATLGASRGTGRARSRNPAGAQRSGPFRTCSTSAAVSTHSVNRRTIEALIKAGAFDGIEPAPPCWPRCPRPWKRPAGRAQRQPGFAVRRRQRRRGGRAGQGRALGPAEAQEKSALGYYCSGHLFDAWRDEVRRIVPMQLARLEPQRDLQWMCGVLAGVRTMMTRRARWCSPCWTTAPPRSRSRCSTNSAKAPQPAARGPAHHRAGQSQQRRLFRRHAHRGRPAYDLQLAREARARSLRVKRRRRRRAAAAAQSVPRRAENGIPGVPVDIVYTRTISCARSGWARNGACAWPTRCSRT